MAGPPWILLPLLVLPVLLGLGILRCAGIGVRRDWLFACGAAYGIGALAVAGVIAAFVMLGLPLKRGPVLGVLLGALLGTLLGSLAIGPNAARALGRDSIEPPALAPRQAHGWVEQLLFVASLCLCSLSMLVEAVDGSKAAITVSDEATHYFAKSCEIFDLGRFGTDYARALQDGRVAAPDYPLLNPLLQVYAHVCNGGIARVDARIPIQAFMLAMVFVLGGSLARWTRPGLAALLLPLALLTTAMRGLAQCAAADGLVAFGLLLATDGALARHRGDTARAAPMFALGLAIATMAKNEGTLLTVLLVLASLPALARARDRARALRWLALPATILAAQYLFNRVHGFSYYLLDDYGKGNLVARFLRQAPTHAGAVLRTFTRELLFPATCTNGLFAALLLLVALAPRAARAAGALWPALALCAAVLGHATLMIGTGTDLAWSLQSATPRLWMQLCPSAALLVGVSLAPRSHPFAK